MSVTIVKVENNRQLKRFVKFGYELYKECPYYVPELFEDAMNTLRKDRNAAFEFCDADYFLAYKDGVLAGRIAVLVNKAANEKWGQNAARFGWVDFIDLFFSNSVSWAFISIAANCSLAASQYASKSGCLSGAETITVGLIPKMKLCAPFLFTKQLAR